MAARELSMPLEQWATLSVVMLTPRRTIFSERWRRSTEKRHALSVVEASLALLLVATG
jgi:hypothetical protein